MAAVSFCADVIVENTSYTRTADHYPGCQINTATAIGIARNKIAKTRTCTALCCAARSSYCRNRVVRPRQHGTLWSADLRGVASIIVDTVTSRNISSDVVAHDRAEPSFGLICISDGFAPDAAQAVTRYDIASRFGDRSDRRTSKRLCINSLPAIPKTNTTRGVGPEFITNDAIVVTQ